MAEKMDFTDQELLMIAVLLDEDEERSSTKKRRIWVHPTLQRRLTEGEFHTLFPQLLEDDTRFHQYFRMSKEQFQILLCKIDSDLVKQDTSFRAAISPRERLAVCLR